ncbi:P-loop containing nucleoside triphosphate hydrolase protein [Trichoderma chlorosporum]
MNEELLQLHSRNITDNKFGDYVTINQGDVHHHHPPKPPQPRVPIRSIPYLQNKEFVDRPDLVNKLNTLLPQDSASFNDAALWGLGGSGKTQIALEYAYRRCENAQCSVFWVHADTKTAFIHDYKKIAEMFGLNEMFNGQELELLRTVSNRIQNEPQWLLVLDNADDLSLFGIGEAEEGSINLLDFVPKGTAAGTAGTILWTSRDGQIAGSLVHPSSRTIQVSHMTSAEAKELLAIARGNDSNVDDNGSDDDEENDVLRLLEELQWLPLAISQAGAYIRRAQATVQEYLALLSNNEERWPLLKEEQFDLHRKSGVPNSILKVWSISVSRIEQESSLASKLLRTMAYFDNRDIPQDMIDATARHGNTTKLTSIEVKKAIIRLREFSFISLRKGEKGSQSYEMHKLVQEATRYAASVIERMGQEDDPKQSVNCFAKIAIQVVDGLFPHPPKGNVNGSASAGKELHAAILRSERYFPHAIQVADWAEISNQEDAVRVLLNRVSFYLYDSKRWKEKASVDFRILALTIHLFGADHFETTMSEQLIAGSLLAQNRYAEAAEFQTRVLKKHESSLGEQDYYTLEAKHNVADVFCKLLRFEEAEKIQAEALCLLEKLVDERVGTLMAESLHCLARAYYGQKKFDEIGEVCVRSLMHCRDNIDGPRCRWYVVLADRAIRFKRQAMIVQGCRRSKTAGVMKGLAEEICERIQKQPHLDEISRIELLAVMKANITGPREAVEMQVKVVDHYCKTFGETHFKTVEKMQQLARLLHHFRQYAKAEVLQLKVVKLFQDVIGEEHPRTLDSMIFLAAIYMSLKRVDEAREMQEKVNSLYSKILGRPFSATFYHYDKMPTMVHLDDENEEEAKMHKEVAAALAQLAARPIWLIAVDRCMVMCQMAAESIATGHYRPLFVLCLFILFFAIFLSRGFTPKSFEIRQYLWLTS